MILLTSIIAYSDTHVTSQHSGCDDERSDWNKFLECWESGVLANLSDKNEDELFQPWFKEALERGSLRFSAATEADIQSLEESLDLTLPRSFKQFLRTTNGWIQINLDIEDALVYPTAEVDYFRNNAPYSITAWSVGLILGGFLAPGIPDNEYLVYDVNQDPVKIRDRYLLSAIMISEEVESAVFLLNPKTVTSDCEFDAWYFGYHLPGAIRFRSFAELMKHSYIFSAERSGLLYPYTDNVLKGTCADYIVVK